MNEFIHNKGNYESMWIKWMPLRYFLAYICLIFGPPVCASFALVFWILAGPVMSYLWAEKSCRHSAASKWICCIWPFYLIALYFTICCFIFVAPLLAVLYYLTLIVVTLLIIFE